MNRAVSVRFLICIIFMLQLISCNMKTYKLLNNKTSVPSDINAYKNRSKFDVSLLNIIDTSVVYEEYDRNYNILKRTDSHKENSIYAVCRFYSNGCMNKFFIDRKTVLTPNEFDPLYAGKRGIYYKENNKIRFDLFAEIDQQRHIGRLTGALTFNGDTLYIKRDDLSYREIFIKRTLPPEYFQYKANW
jgi:hypothetical protein